MTFEEITETGEFAGSDRKHEVVVAGFVNEIRIRDGSAGGRGGEGKLVG